LERVRFIPIAQLADCGGTVAEDIVSPTKALLLPKGTELRWIQTSLPSVVRRLSEAGIGRVAVQDSLETSMESLEEVLQTLSPPQLSQVNHSLARHATRQIGDVYSRIENHQVTPEDLGHLMDTGKTLAREIARTTQISLSLGRVKEQDEYTFVHSLNVALLSGFLAHRILGDPAAVESITVGALLHDLGKALIPREVLNKPGKLNDQEFAVIQRHPEEGHSMAVQNGVVDEVALAVVRFHHERWRGDGYPHKLNGEEIPLPARISAVADVFDALTTARVYKGPIARDQAISMIVTSGGSHFDPAVVRTMLLALGLYPPGMLVELADGSVGTVVAAKEGDLMRPLVLLQVDGRGFSAPPATVVDTSTSPSLFIRRSLGDMEKRSL